MKLHPKNRFTITECLMHPALYDQLKMYSAKKNDYRRETATIATFKSRQAFLNILKIPLIKL